MSGPVRRGRLDVLDRLRPGLADSARAVLGRARGAGPSRERGDLLARATAAVLISPDDPAAARAGLETALDLRERLPGAAADRLLVVAGGRVRAGGAAAPTEVFLDGVPADEAARLRRRLRTVDEAAPDSPAGRGAQHPGGARC